MQTLRADPAMPYNTQQTGPLQYPAISGSAIPCKTTLQHPANDPAIPCNTLQNDPAMPPALRAYVV
eukprot:688195-Pyramimonas_sp.AAC.1